MAHADVKKKNHAENFHADAKKISSAVTSLSQINLWIADHRNSCIDRSSVHRALEENPLERQTTEILEEADLKFKED